MSLSFEDELRAFLRHHYEQMPEVQEVLVLGRKAIDPMEGYISLSRMIGVHNEAPILVAQEIDKLRAATAD
jgi:hypothetical protein